MRLRLKHGQEPTWRLTNQTFPDLFSNTQMYSIYVSVNALNNTKKKKIRRCQKLTQARTTYLTLKTRTYRRFILETSEMEINEGEMPATLSFLRFMLLLMMTWTIDSRCSVAFTSPLRVWIRMGFSLDLKNLHRLWFQSSILDIVSSQ